MPLPLKAFVRENPVGKKNRYIEKRYNVCFPTIHLDLQHKGAALVRSAPCTRFGLWSIAHIYIVELSSPHIGH